VSKLKPETPKGIAPPRPKADENERNERALFRHERALSKKRASLKKKETSRKRKAMSLPVVDPGKTHSQPKKMRKVRKDPSEPDYLHWQRVALSQFSSQEQEEDVCIETSD
jgi:hypothetical protein